MNRRRGRPIGSRKRIGSPRGRRRQHAYHMFRHSFGAQLRKLLDEQDISAATFAKSLGCCRGAVLGWLRGRCVPPVATLLDMSMLLDCTLVDLLPEDAHHR